MSDGKEQDVVRRYHLLFMTAALLAATLEVALPNLRVEFRDLEGESLQEETIVSPRPTTQETARRTIS
jgi:hypothetical protein